MANRILEVLHYAAWICALVWILFSTGYAYSFSREEILWGRVIACLVALFGIVLIPAPFWYIVAKKWYVLPWQHKGK
jgi:hypothetical protein